MGACRCLLAAGCAPAPELVQCGGTYAAQLASCQRRLKHVGGVQAAFTATSAHCGGGGSSSMDSESHPVEGMLRRRTRR